MKLRSVAVGIFVCALPSIAMAQGAQTATAAPKPAPAAAPSPEAPPAAGAPHAAAAPAGDPRVTGNVGGASYSDKPPPGARAAAPRRAKVHKPTGPVVSLPGFEQLGDGGSRLFVQLSQAVPVEERKAQGTITYVLKGANARVRNNTNPLVTVHFSTPVSRARLVPHGPDLHFVVELRAAAVPTHKIAEGADKTSILTIDFPKGDYGVADPSTEAGSTSAPKGNASPGKAPVTPSNPAPQAPPPPAAGPTP